MFQKYYNMYCGFNVTHCFKSGSDLTEIIVMETEEEENFNRNLYETRH